jgi:hypothetical protein
VLPSLLCSRPPVKPTYAIRFTSNVETNFYIQDLPPPPGIVVKTTMYHNRFTGPPQYRPNLPIRENLPPPGAAGHRELPHLPQPRPEHHGQRAPPSGTRPRAPAPSSSIMHSEADAFVRLIISSAQQDFYSQATNSCRRVKINTGALLFRVFAVDVLHLSTRKCSVRTALARIYVSTRIEFLSVVSNNLKPGSKVLSKFFVAPQGNHARRVGRLVSAGGCRGAR